MRPEAFLRARAAALLHSRRPPHLLFALATLTTLLSVGYHFGTFDQAIHIPFLRKFADPSLYPDDAFFEMRFQHYSYFWFLWLPFERWGVLEETLFVVHLLVTYFTFWMLWWLSLTLFDDPLTAALTVVVFAMPHLGFGAFPVLEFSLLNRTFVLPFILAAIALYLRGRVRLACLLLGLLYNLHVISVNFALAMLGLDMLLRLRALGWRTVVAGGLCFVGGALPVLVWKAGGPPIRLAADPQWFDAVRQQLYHLYYPLDPRPHVLIPTLSGLAAMLFVPLARREAPARYDGRVAHFLDAVLLVVGLQILLPYVYPVTILLQLQIVRIGLFATVFGYLYLVRFLVSRHRRAALSTADLALLLLAATVLPFSLLFWLFWGIGWGPGGGGRRRRGIALAVAAVMEGAVMVAAVRYGAWGPGLHVYGPRNAWQAVQLWARDHTPRDALFITPPYRWDFYDSEWRVFSERSTLVTFSDLLEVALVPDYTPLWRERFEQLAPGALARCRGDYFENRRLIAEAFHTLTAEDVRRIAARYGADYLVVERAYTYPFPLLYANDAFALYALPADP